MIKPLIIVLTFLVSVGSAVAEEASSWVKPLSLPGDLENTRDFRDDGVLNLLLDRQVRLTDDGYEQYQRRVVRIINRTGLEAEGAIALDFDPQEEELTVHDIWRTRNGARSRVTGLEFLDIRREASIDYGILDGRLTRYVDVPDLRVGDTLDVSATRRGAHSVFKGHYNAMVTDHPISRFHTERFRLLTRDTWDVVVSGPAKPTKSAKDGWSERVWLHDGVKREEPDHYWQDWQAFYGFTQVSTASTWMDIVNRVLPRYTPQPLPDDLLETVRSFDGSTSERVSAAFRFVQDEIRYMGIEIGDGGYLPRSPELVWSRRFGDCKDKALLLVSMLVEMGIAADVVLVHSSNGDMLENRSPSPFLFNHAIVRVLGDGETYFLDPTDVMQGGIGNRVVVPDYVWALPISEGSDRLVEVPKIRAPEPTYEVLSRYEFQETGHYAAKLVVETTYRREAADYQRYKLANDGIENRAERFLKWYKKRYPETVAITPMFTEDNLDTNVLVIHERYGLSDTGLEERRDKFWMNPYAIKGELEELPEDGFDEPYPLDPLFHRHRVELVGFEGLKPPPDFRLDNAFFRYVRTGYKLDNGVGGLFEVEVLADEVTPREADTYSDQVEQQDKNDDRRYRLSRSSRVLASALWMGLRLDLWLVFGSIILAVALGLIAAFHGYRLERKNF